jgi:YndJ-like protein
VSSRGSVLNRPDEQWTGVMSVCGTAMWSVLAVLAGLHRLHFGIIELLFLLAPLVIVPLGLELAHSLAESDIVPAGIRRASQVVATVAACVAMWIPPGRNAAILASLWLLYCGVMTYSRLGRRQRKHSILSRIIDLAHLDLVLGAAWLVVSRANWRPVGFQEPIILLTAVHFHYSGFATALLSAATLRHFEDHGEDVWVLRLLLVTIVLLPFAVAAGFVFYPLLRFAAALALAVAVMTLGVVWLRLSGDLQNAHARFFLRFSACAVVAAFSLSSLYAVSEYFGKGWITVSLMANTHGVLNSLGFVLPGLLAWLIQGRAARTFPKEQTLARWAKQSPSLGERKRPAPAHPIPEFVAREFYDR